MKFRWSFCLIVLIFLVTRIYNLSSAPASAYWDEASIGVNAYSVLLTGKDEWGEFLPIHFKAFGEYKLPIYIYATIPFIKALGLNLVSVRLPSIVFSLVSVMLVYLIFKNSLGSRFGAFFAAAYMVISPWFFIFSRTGYEASAGVMFFCLSIYLFLKSGDSRKYFILSSLALIGSIYSYNSYRVVSLLTFVIFSTILFLRDKRFHKELLIAALCVVLSLIPVFALVKSSGAVRLEQVGFYDFSESKPQNLVIFAVNYFSHFDPRFLFLTGDSNPRSQQTGFGQMYWIDAFLLILFIYMLRKHKPKRMILPIALLLLAPIPAALTRESPHALRSISAVPLLSLILGWTIERVRQTPILSGQNQRFGKILLTVILVAWTISFGIYFKGFLSDYPKESAVSWQYPYKLLYDKYAKSFAEYDHIKISDMYDQPYIFFLFYNQFDPAVFQKKAEFNLNIRRHTSLVKKIEKVDFERIDYYNFAKEKSLIFAHPSERLTEIDAKDIIYNLDKSVAFYVYEILK